MRKAYIVSYDLSTPGQNYETVLKAIKKYPGWARLGGSSYIVLADETAAQIRDSIMSNMDSNDKLFIGTVTAPAAWIGLGDEVSDWLKNNLK